MDGSKAELKVGATVLVALAILVAGLLWLKGYRMAESNVLERLAADLKALHGKLGGVPQQARSS